MILKFFRTGKNGKTELIRSEYTYTTPKKGASKTRLSPF